MNVGHFITTATHKIS